MGNRDSVMIMVAPNGARRNKRDHERLPMTAPELADDALACLEAGACAIHMHVRDDDGAHVLDAGRYREATRLVADRCRGEMAIQITTEAVGRYAPGEQMQVVRDLVPEAVSVAVRELVPDAAAESQASAFFSWLKRKAVSPQFILYDAEDVERFWALQERGVIPFSEPFLLFVLGRYAQDQQSAPGDLEPFLTANAGRPGAWAMCAFGLQEAACASAAMENGGHVRVGFENNMHRLDGSLAESNAELVSIVAEAARGLGRTLIDANAARALFAQALQ